VKFGPKSAEWIPGCLSMYMTKHISEILLSYY
jgi:hypothetical protein